MGEVRTIKYYGDRWGGPISDFETAWGAKHSRRLLGRMPRLAILSRGWGVLLIATIIRMLSCLNILKECRPAIALGEPVRPSNNFLHARSRHRGGVNVSCVDASVHFVGDSIDLKVWRGFRPPRAAKGEPSFNRPTTPAIGVIRSLPAYWVVHSGRSLSVGTIIRQRRRMSF